MMQGRRKGTMGTLRNWEEDRRYRVSRWWDKGTWPTDSRPQHLPHCRSFCLHPSINFPSFMTLSSINDYTTSSPNQWQLIICSFYPVKYRIDAVAALKAFVALPAPYLLYLLSTWSAFWMQCYIFPLPWSYHHWNPKHRIQFFPPSCVSVSTKLPILPFTSHAIFGVDGR